MTYPNFSVLPHGNHLPHVRLDGHDGPHASVEVAPHDEAAAPEQVTHDELLVKAENLVEPNKRRVPARTR